MAKHHEVRGTTEQLLSHIDKTGRLTFTVPGPPRTKKTSNRLVMAGGKHRVLPSESWEMWCNAAVPVLAVMLGPMRAGVERTRVKVEGREITMDGTYKGPIAHPVNCRAIFFRDALRGDAVGYYQGLADLLQKARVVEDDKWIVSWDGSRLAKDAERPRVEVVLSWGVG